MSFLPGKLPINTLKRTVFPYLGMKRDDIILGPSVGEDAAIVKVGNEVLAIATDPITGAEEWIGWLAVNVSANDIATCGVQPNWFTSCILLPTGSKEELIENICSQADRAARKLNIAIISGHCEITPGINHPIVIGCAVGKAEAGNYVTSGGAKPGNVIILTKGTGIEGTAILASDKRDELLNVFDEHFVKKAENFFEQISVVLDALTAFKTGGVTAMHDPTEGGIAGGLHELADAANVGFQVYQEKILVPPETQKICAYFGIDPLQLLSSGSLLITAKKEKSEEIKNKLMDKGIHSSLIGETVKPESGRKIITKIGKKIDLVKPVSDHIWSAVAEKYEL